MPDEVLSQIAFSTPWQYNPEGVAQGSTTRDADGFPITGTSAEDKSLDSFTRQQLQDECWLKFHKNPQLNTAIRGLVGRLTGLGYEVTSSVRQIQDFVDSIWFDWRNKLYHFWPKFCGRSYIDGELYLVVTCHRDGFIEVDFLEPKAITGSSNQDKDDGILFHPRKTHLPLLYNIKIRLHEYQEREYQLPSIYVARDPSLLSHVKTDQLYDAQKLGEARRDPHSKFKAFGGFSKFVIAFDRSFVTRRAVSYLRTTLEWLNHYENLKKYEIDHKKSSGAYLWTFTFEDVKAFKNWLLLSDEEKRATGIGAKKVPGSSLVLPPGMTVAATHPQLPRISDEDTDIMQMISSGLNEPEDVTLGKSARPFGAVKMSRGPMSDRISDEVALWDRFSRFDFWGNLFFLHAKLNSRFPLQFVVKEAVDFDASKEEPEPIFKNVKRKPEQLIEINYPSSEILGLESTAKATLWVKHGNLSDILGIPKSEISRKLGFGNYRRLRLKHATEEDALPPLTDPEDDEMLQEQRIEKPRPTAKPRKK
jgi:hypothetical protein